MTCRPLPKTVAPLPDELLSGWLSRLAASNHCEVSELLTHLEIDARHVAALDYEIDVAAVDRISVAGRIDPVCVPSMTFAAISEDDPKQGVSQADVYQLMAYSQLYRCPNVMLLYPHHGDLPPDPIRTRYAIASEGAEDSLLVATMDVTGSSQTHAEALKHLIQGALREHELA